MKLITAEVWSYLYLLQIVLEVMFRRTVLVLLSLMAVVTVTAQVGVSGLVVEEGTDEPLTGASVILRDAGGQIKKYGSTDAKGRIAISAPTIKG